VQLFGKLLYHSVLCIYFLTKNKLCIYLVSWHDQFVPLAGSVKCIRRITCSNIGPDVLLILVSSIDAGRIYHELER